MTTAQAYEAAAVPDGGTISRTITLLDVIPPAKSTKVTENARDCAAEARDETLNVGADRGFKNVVVWVMDILAPAGGAFGTCGIQRL